MLLWQLSLENIQKTVAEYYKIKMADRLCKRRNRSVARPRQVAMTLARELTNHSLPEIGDGFGGRDHTTVLHACKKIRDLRASDQDIGDARFTRILMALTVTPRISAISRYERPWYSTSTSVTRCSSGR